MGIDRRALWRRYCTYHLADSRIGFSLDVSRVRFEDADLDRMQPALSAALDAMEALEKGAIANRDEDRRVGHYWLRAPDLAPTGDVQAAIRDALAAIRAFAGRVRDGSRAGQGGTFKHLLHVGIGGSALGPQLLAGALGEPGEGLGLHFIDNTDPDGIDRVLARLEGSLGRTLVCVASKSGTTPEPRNGLRETQLAYERAGLDFARHAAAITMAGSPLDREAERDGWLERFPMWDWVGGRTSVTSAAGLLPAALAGIDIDAVLAGAAAMDRLTRERDLRRNPAALLAAIWHHLGRGRGERDMVVLPYKDRLSLLGRYLQQLVMESLGKERDRSGRVVRQGIAVYGNKGSTDQHAYVQQLLDGAQDFFVIFVRVLSDRDGPSVEVEPGITAGDYLSCFLDGTRRALHDKGRDSITITLDRAGPARIGALIALFERAVGLYAELIDVNAYHQPGVEAGKEAAEGVLDLQKKAVEYLRSTSRPGTAEEIASGVGAADESETVYTILEHLAANPGRGVVMERGETPAAAIFRRA